MTFAMHQYHAITAEQAAVLADACPRGGLLLEIGTHRGWGTQRLWDALESNGRLVTVEIDPDLAAAARAALPEGVEAVCADAHSWRPPQEPDVIIIDGPLNPYERLAMADAYRTDYPTARIFVHDSPTISAMEERP